MPTAEVDFPEILPTRHELAFSAPRRALGERNVSPFLFRFIQSLIITNPDVAKTVLDIVLKPVLGEIIDEAGTVYSVEAFMALQPFEREKIAWFIVSEHTRRNNSRDSLARDVSLKSRVLPQLEIQIPSKWQTVCCEVRPARLGIDSGPKTTEYTMALLPIVPYFRAEHSAQALKTPCSEAVLPQLTQFFELLLQAKHLPPQFEDFSEVIERVRSIQNDRVEQATELTFGYIGWAQSTCAQSVSLEGSGCLYNSVRHWELQDYLLTFQQRNNLTVRTNSEGYYVPSEAEFQTERTILHQFLSTLPDGNRVAITALALQRVTFLRWVARQRLYRNTDELLLGAYDDLLVAMYAAFDPNDETLFDLSINYRSLLTGGWREITPDGKVKLDTHLRLDYFDLAALLESEKKITKLLSELTPMVSSERLHTTFSAGSSESSAQQLQLAQMVALLRTESIQWVGLESFRDHFLKQSIGDQLEIEPPLCLVNLFSAGDFDSDQVPLFAAQCSPLPRLKDTREHHEAQTRLTSSVLVNSTDSRWPQFCHGSFASRFDYLLTQLLLVEGGAEYLSAASCGPELFTQPSRSVLSGNSEELSSLPIIGSFEGKISVDEFGRLRTYRIEVEKATDPFSELALVQQNAEAAKAVFSGLVPEERLPVGELRSAVESIAVHNPDQARISNLQEMCIYLEQLLGISLPSDDKTTLLETLQRLAAFERMTECVSADMPLEYLRQELSALHERASTIGLNEHTLLIALYAVLGFVPADLIAESLFHSFRATEKLIAAQLILHIEKLHSFGDELGGGIFEKIASTLQKYHDDLVALHHENPNYDVFSDPLFIAQQLQTIGQISAFLGSVLEGEESVHSIGDAFWILNRDGGESASIMARCEVSGTLLQLLLRYVGDLLPAVGSAETYGEEPGSGFREWLQAIEKTGTSGNRSHRFVTTQIASPNSRQPLTVDVDSMIGVPYSIIPPEAVQLVDVSTPLSSHGVYQKYSVYQGIYHDPVLVIKPDLFGGSYPMASEALRRETPAYAYRLAADSIPVLSARMLDQDEPETSQLLALEQILLVEPKSLAMRDPSLNEVASAAKHLAHAIYLAVQFDKPIIGLYAVAVMKRIYKAESVNVLSHFDTFRQHFIDVARKLPVVMLEEQLQKYSHLFDALEVTREDLLEISEAEESQHTFSQEEISVALSQVQQFALAQVLYQREMKIKSGLCGDIASRQREDDLHKRSVRLQGFSRGDAFLQRAVGESYQTTSLEDGALVWQQLTQNCTAPQKKVLTQLLAMLALKTPQLRFGKEAPLALQLERIFAQRFSAVTGSSLTAALKVALPEIQQSGIAGLLLGSRKMSPTKLTDESARSNNDR